MLTMASDAIHIEALGKSFERVTVLNDVTLRVRAGEIMALVGANGAGKTTLLEMLATVQLPTRGRATVGGYDLAGRGAQIRRIVGYCPAGTESFYPQLTGLANLEFFASLHGLAPHEARSRARIALATMGAAAVSDVKFQQCSAGMKQRLTIARALVADPQILLLDEPTRSLDAEARTEFHRWLRHSFAGARNGTVLLVTHDSDEVDACCDRIAVLEHGAIGAVRRTGGTPADAPARMSARSATA